MAREIEEFKAEYRQRFPERDAEAITDEDLLREVMNTVGKPGRLGEQIKCVVSVSMLTEGWDANTVTHVLGIRAFSTQLLCEQVVGPGAAPHHLRHRPRDRHVPGRVRRGLRRAVLVHPGGAGDQHAGVAKEGDARAGAARARRPRAHLPAPHRLPLRARRREAARASSTSSAGMSLSTADVPTKVESATRSSAERRSTRSTSSRRGAPRRSTSCSPSSSTSSTSAATTRPASRRASPGSSRRSSTRPRAWRRQCLTCKDDCFPQMLLLVEYAHTAADKIYRAIVDSTPGEQTLLPILQPYDTVGSTSYVDFDTTRPVMVTDPEKCHISHVVCDTDSWEQKMAQVLEDMDEVESYVKNHNLGFFIPYTYEGEAHNYIPDFIVRLRAPDGAQPLNLIIEVSGEAKPEKAAKVETARSLWVPAVNNHGGFGRWAFLEISDPWDAKNTIRAHLAATPTERVTMAYQNASIAKTHRRAQRHVLPACDPARVRLGPRAHRHALRLDPARLPDQLVPLLEPEAPRTPTMGVLRLRQARQRPGGAQQARERVAACRTSPSSSTGSSGSRRCSSASRGQYTFKKPSDAVGQPRRLGDAASSISTC